MNKKAALIFIICLLFFSVSYQTISAQESTLNSSSVISTNNFDVHLSPPTGGPPLVLDQSQEDITYGFWFDNTQLRWQEFIPTVDNLKEVHLRIGKTGNPGDVTVQIRNGSGTVIIDARYVPEAAIPSGSTWVTVDFAQIPSLELIPGDTYRIYVFSSQVYSPENMYSWRGNVDSTYCLKCDTDVYATWPNFDYTFRTYGYGTRRVTNADFDGNRSTDISVYRPSNGKWYIQGESPIWWGMGGDIPVPGEYTDSGFNDIAIYRPSNGKWYVYGEAPVWWGMPNDVPMPGDYNGDGATDIAVYRPSNGNWYVHGESPVWWGMVGDIPVPGDYDGDFIDEFAVYRPSNGKWYVYGEAPVWWGMPGDIPVPGDYDGDGITDIAVYRPSNGKWYVYGEAPVWWGMPGDIPVPGDYDGCGDAEIAVLRPSNGKWYIKGGDTVWHYLPGDYPLPVRDTNADGDEYY